ncbi:MAG: FAD:protein FMN transferase [Victivallales bacterium]|nr:FAD:protein FMN transferase [Victivallales bacterium]MBQ6470678.1 FAD:protein FMN transferase [Victivallales bacterium]
MTEKNAIILRLILRTGVFLMAVGVLVREISCNHTRPGGTTAQTISDAAEAYTYSVYAFDTKCSLTLWGDKASADQVAAEAIQIINRLHATLNRYDDESELARFNAVPADSPFACSDMLWQAFDAAREAYQLTDGAFDITIGPLMAFWKQVACHPEQPTLPEELAIVKERVGLDKLIFDETAHMVTKTRNGISVDFGGLAKGLALDLVRPLLDRPGITRANLDFGGNLYLDNPAGLPAAGEILIRAPRLGDHASGEMLGKITNANRRFIATSANTERPLLATNGRFIGHIMDPRTGNPVMTMEQVTAITTSGVYSDIFSTAVFIGGLPLAECLAGKIPDTGFVLLQPETAEPSSVGDVNFTPFERH